MEAGEEVKEDRVGTLPGHRGIIIIIIIIIVFILLSKIALRPQIIIAHYGKFTDV